MRSFVFPLEPVLEQRRRKGEEACALATAAQRELVFAESALQQLRDRHSASSSGLNFAMQRTVLDMQLFHEYAADLEHEIAEKEHLVTEKRTCLVDAQAQHMLAARDRKCIEIIQTRRYQTHRR